MGKAIFIDRDGVLLREPLFDPSVGSASEVIDTWERFEILPDIARAFAKLKNKGYRLIVISNQDGIGDEFLSSELYSAMNKKLLQYIRENNGAKIDQIYECPHSINNKACNCRKPKRGLIDKALKDFPDINLSQSWFVGDRASDVKLGKSIGIRTVFIKADHELPGDIISDMIAMNLDEAVNYILKNQ